MTAPLLALSDAVVLGWPEVATIARVVLASTFGLSAGTKIADRSAAAKAAADLGVPSRLSGAVAIVLPIVELTTALLLLVRPVAALGSLLGLGLLAVFSAAVGRVLAKGERPTCHCFGALSTEPVGPHTLVRNGLLGLVALVALVQAVGGEPAGIGDTLDHLGVVGVVGAVALVLAATAAGVAWRFRRQATTSATDLAELREAVASGGGGLPAFSLQTVHGDAIDRSVLLPAGRAVAVLFVSTTCGSCTTLVPDLRSWLAEVDGRADLHLAVASGVDRMAATFGTELASRAVMDLGFAAARSLGVPGTPSGLFVSPNGSHKAVRGGPQILEALGEMAAEVAGLARPTGREGGAPLPPLPLLAGVDGTTWTPDRLAAPGAALLFADAGCGWSDTVLQRLASRANPPAGLVLVGPASAVEAPAFAAVGAPLVVDAHRMAWSALQIAGTPTLLRIGADGTIVTTARGVRAVLEELDRPL